MTNGSGILLYQPCRLKKCGDGERENKEGKMKNTRVERKYNKRNKK